jgi:hypothetical protein
VTVEADRAAVYELTVKGAVGPVVRHALAREGVGTPAGFTIVRTGPAHDADVVDVVRALADGGFDVDGVIDLTNRA